MPTALFANLLYWLYGSGFIVCMLARNQQHIIRQEISEMVKIY